MASSREHFGVHQDDLIENEIVTDDRPQESERFPSPETDSITIDTISCKLIRDNLLLTALELHTELVESGRELPRLRDFFSNPANFERMKQSEASSPGLPRTSSCQTFDSLDFARYSDDGDRQVDDRVAVLEFELRKAHDTIKSLRASLTKSAETELPSPVESPSHLVPDFETDEPIKPYEKRALNHLVNEYLLVNDNKLTSVTFAEENENQDFEDWDDVGLNVPKPPDLLHLYRDFNQHIVPVVERVDFGCQAVVDDSESVHREAQMAELIQELKTKVDDLDCQIQSLQNENLVLAEQLMFVERKQQESRFIKTSTPAVTPIKNVGPADDRKPAINIVPPENDSTVDSVNEEVLAVPITEKDESQKNEVSATRTEVTNNPNPAEPYKHEATKDNLSQKTDDMFSIQVEPGSRQDITGMDSTGQAQLEKNDATTKSTDENTDEVFTWHHFQRKMSEAFRRALLSTSFSLSQDNRILSEVNKIIDSNSEKVVLMLARCLPHIVPNVLLNKREELIPIILCTATLHPESKERDQLLNLLFNLIKRPDFEQRQMILTGCVAFAQHVGPLRVEAELLPQCWEQINHKYAERRLLVAEACGALAPYLPNEMRSSLVLSMLQQMLCDDKDEEVRESVVRSLGLLTGFIDDEDKYTQGYELLNLALYDSNEKVVASTQQVFVPSFAMWSEELGKLRSHLIPGFLDKIEEMTKRAKISAHIGQHRTTMPLDEMRFNWLVITLQEVVPILFASVLVSGPYIDKLHSVTSYNNLEVSTRFPKTTTELTDLSVILGSPDRLSRVLHLYEQYLSQDGAVLWEKLSWVADELIPRLLGILGNIDVSLPKVTHMLSRFFFHLCRYFGRRFTQTKISPKFQTVLYIPDEQIDTQVASGQTLLNTCTVPVYVAGVITAFNKDEDRKHLVTFLKDILSVISLCSAPLDSIKAAFTELSTNSSHHESMLTVLWEAVVHTSALVRATAARLFELVVKFLNETLVATRAVPALVTLASDAEISVRIATVPAFGTVVENVTERTVLDKVHMQLQTFMDDPIYKDQHALHVELIRTLARVGPNAEPKFRDDFVLPRLAVMAAHNNHATNETRRADITMQLLEAYSALACCFINDQLIREAMLPGLRCLKSDLLVIDPVRVDVVNSMIREFEDKLETSHSERSSMSNAPAPGSSSPSLSHSSFAMGLTDENMKAKMLHRLKDLKDKSATARSNIFNRKK